MRSLMLGRRRTNVIIELDRLVEPRCAGNFDIDGTRR
jgi:hypothetical protein